MNVDTDGTEAERTLRAIFATFGCPQDQTERAVLAWKRNRLEALRLVHEAALSLWEHERNEVAAMVCPRCAVPEAYSRPSYLLKMKGRRVRAHRVFGKPGRFKTCLAARIVELRPPTR